MKKSVIAIAFILITHFGFSQQTAWKIVEGKNSNTLGRKGKSIKCIGGISTSTNGA